MAKSAIGDAIENMAKAVIEAVGRAVASLGTVWVNIGTPNLTSTGGSSSVGAGSSAGNAGNITTVLGYVTWISLAIALIALFILGGLIATRMRSGEGITAVGRIGVVLTAVVMVSAASSLVGALLPDRPQRVAGTVAFLQSSLWWYMGAAAVLSVIIGGLRMAWEQRAEPGRDLLRSLMTLVVVAGAGVGIINLLVAAADSFAVWILDNSLACDFTAGGACFGENIVRLLKMPADVGAGAGAGLGPLLLIILGLLAIMASVVQILLMVARAGMLVILAGILPLAAAATNTEMGRTWFRKAVAWLVAFILYKPAAAIVYAAAFQLAGTDLFTDDGSGLLSVLTGLMLMVIALFAMPALMRFVTPMVGAMASGSGGAAMGAAALAALPTGAAAAGRLGSGGGGTDASSGPGQPGATGNSGTAGPTSNPPGSTAGSQSPATPTGQPTASNAPAKTGTTSTGTSTGTAATTTTGAGAGAVGAGAGAGAGATAAGAAAGPVGMAAGVALDAAKAGGQAAAGAARALGEQSIGEGEGPSGSR
ncbi:hypothetical protein [Cellulomonas cellasea]|uniref:Uncharacterized protein n=1 Tax=Cellulomonas cellasea TaxID=43670 RepID=A0A7W4YEH6_9CELL|nr:hypothetical protein [Cellulomonas cellasea]MBB2925586.1 hypothetical protein [Cellulomonas cellasea]